MPTHGYAETREAAMAAFAKSWRRENWLHLLMSAALLERRMPQTALHLGADPRHKTIADFLAAIERRRNLAQPPREGGEVSGQL
jgi:hypothetical protein